MGYNGEYDIPVGLLLVGEHVQHVLEGAVEVLYFAVGLWVVG
jgi:hypothetical protein